MILYGCGGIGIVALEVAQARGHRNIRFFDDRRELTEFQGIQVHPGTDLDPALSIAPDEAITVCVGANAVRKKLCTHFSEQLHSLIHPTATISPSATIGSGTLVFHGSIVQASAQVGRGVILNTGASIDHECILEDYVHIAPNTTLCGYVHVKEGANVGAAVTAIPSITIGRWATVGAGAVLIDDVPDYATVVGVPGRVVTPR